MAENDLTKPMIPDCNKENDCCRKWIDAIIDISLIRLRLISYRQILFLQIEKEYSKIISLYRYSLLEEVGRLWDSLRECSSLIDSMFIESDSKCIDENTVNNLKDMKAFFESSDRVIEVIRSEHDCEEIIQKLQIIGSLMMLLYPIVKQELEHFF